MYLQVDSSILFAHPLIWHYVLTLLAILIFENIDPKKLEFTYDARFNCFYQKIIDVILKINSTGGTIR